MHKYHIIKHNILKMHYTYTAIITQTKDFFFFFWHTNDLIYKRSELYLQTTQVFQEFLKQEFRRKFQEI